MDDSSIYQFISKLVRNINIGKIRRQTKKILGQYIFRKKYTADDLVSIMQEMGMKKGSLVCIHSSMSQFYNYRGNAQELIEKILVAIGSEGTLMMPAFPVIPKDVEHYIFNPLTDKTGAGYLAETFRKFPGVKRSFNVRASVCAIGPLSDYLLSEHQNGEDCWDEKSPWYKLCEKNGLVFNFGLPRSYMGTFYHCVESRLKHEHPYWKQFFNKEQTYTYTWNGKLYKYKNIDCNIYRRTHEKRIMRYFTAEDWSIRHISNLEIKVFYTGHLFPKLVEMGRKGITAYYCPSPKKYKFDNAN